MGPTALETLLEQAVNLYKKKNYDGALKFIESQKAKFDKNAIALNIQAACLTELEQFEKAEKAYLAAIRINPKYVEAYNNIANLYVRLEKFQIALEFYKKAITFQPKYIDALYNLGILYEILNDYGLALKAYKTAKDLQPLSSHLTYCVGNMHWKLGDDELALKSFQKSIDLKPKFPEALNNAAIILQKIGKTNSALILLKKVITNNPQFYQAYNNLGNICKDLDLYDHALRYYEKCVQENPLYSDGYNNIGALKIELGDHKGAIYNFEKAIELDFTNAEAHRHLSIVKTYRKDDAHLKKMITLESTATCSDYKKSQLNFGIAKAYEDLGDFHAAFNKYVEANKLRKKYLNYTIDEDCHLFNQIRENSRIFAELNCDSKEDYDLDPIFIVGMPRSGTTLVEQILSSHSNVYAGGELSHIQNYYERFFQRAEGITNQTIERVRAHYLKHCSARVQGEKFFTDKMPGNFRFIPLIHAMFPKSKIIHLKRNPIATCWSNFKQYFMVQGLGFSYDLTDLHRYYEMYEKMMEEWSSRFDNSVITVQYEELVDNKTHEIPRLLSKLGMNFELDCLSPHLNERAVKTASQRQVRQIIYSGSSQAWHQYDNLLKNIFPDEFYNKHKN